jgi:hypothetical protein
MSEIADVALRLERFEIEREQRRGKSEQEKAKNR